MGLFDGLMGNASNVSNDSVAKEYAIILTDNERVEKAYQLVRDVFIFTNKRLILVNIQGVTGKKQEYHSIPYKNITHFSIETAGHLDLDAELKVWLSGGNLIEKQFNRSVNIYEVQSVLASYILA